MRSLIHADLPAFLSVRVLEPTRDRLKVAAAARDASVQKLVGGLLERNLNPLQQLLNEMYTDQNYDNSYDDDNSYAVLGFQPVVEFHGTAGANSARSAAFAMRC